jgi:hypothetical protein
MTISQVRVCALALPEAIEAPHFHFTSFRIRGKIFATAPPEGDYLHIFVPPEERAAALAREPDFLEELSWGAKVVGLRVILASAKPPVIAELLAKAWSCRAPKKLLAAWLILPGFEK